MSIVLDVLKEELERNLEKKRVFQNELDSLPKGYLSSCCIGGKNYIYRKRREGNKIISEYIGVPGDDDVANAIAARKHYLEIKEAINLINKEDIKLRKAILAYENI